MKPPLTFGSLFSGIGGIDLGLERAGMTCKFQVEIDEYAQKVLAKHWPNVTRYGDIRTVGSHNIETVDLLCGGFPCQPHSLAGKRKASEDERDLWGEFYRIICEIRPTWVLAENVPGLLSSENGRFFGRVLRDLAQSGYDAEWQVLSAAAFGAPHLRERVFILAYTNGTQTDSLSREAYSQRPQWHPWMEPHTSRYRRHVSQSGQEMAYSNIKRLGIGEIFTSYACQKLTTFKRDCITGSGQWAVESSVCRMADGVPHRLDRLRTLGNAVVPQIAQYIGECILAAVENEVAV